MRVTTTAQVEDQVRRRDIGSSASTATHQRGETGMQPAMKAGRGKGRLAAHEQGVLLPVQPAARASSPAAGTYSRAHGGSAP